MFFLHLMIVILSGLGLWRLRNKAQESESSFLRTYLPKFLIALGVLAIIVSFILMWASFGSVTSKDTVKPCWYCGTKNEVGPGCSVCDGWGFQMTTETEGGSAGGFWAGILYFLYGIFLCILSLSMAPPSVSEHQSLSSTVSSVRSSTTLSDGQWWLCPNCNILNSPNHGQCKKCGTYRGSH